MMKFHAGQAAPIGLIAFATVLTGCALSPDHSHDRAFLSPDLPGLPSPMDAPKEARATPPDDVTLASATDLSDPAASRMTHSLTPESTVRLALENNPILQAFRLQRGFAEGGLVIAKTYPYNPVSQFQLFAATGDGVTNRISQAHKITMDVEVRGQMSFRKEAAYAALTRTEWDIAAQELLVEVAANRAYNTVLYRQRKLYVLEDTIKLNEQVVEQVRKLVDLGRLRPADLLLARTELDAAGAQLGQGRTAIAFALADLRRQLGALDDSFTVEGDLDLPVPTLTPEALAEVARAKRPDLQSRIIAVTEAQAKLNLQVADRYGNPNMGPLFDYNETKNAFYGFQFGGPIPVFNRKNGEIIQAQATVARAAADSRQLQIQAAQDVQAALARLAEARKWSDRYQAEVLPNLRQSVDDMNKLLEQNEPGVDVLKVIGVQRNYLTAFSAYLDALYEVSQARADLAAAVGDPAIALGLYAPSSSPETIPDPKSPFPKPSPKITDPKTPAPLPKPAPVKDKP